MSTPLKHIQASISTISEQLLTAQKGFGELKDFISSPKEHKLLCTEMRDLEFSLKAVQSAILEDLPGFSPNDKFEEFIASFNISFNEFLHMSQESATSILGLPNTKVKKFTVKIQSFRKQITAQFLDDIFSANYEEKQAQIFKSDQAEQKFCSINITAHGGTGGVGGHGGQQGGLGGRGEGAQLTFNNTNTVYLAAKISSNDNKMNKILNWLTPLNFYQHQDATFATWQKGTGQLFLSLPEFKTWLSNSEKVLWCEGPPGAGKTVLSSLVVKHLEDHFQKTDVGLAYIYINHKELENQSPTALFASLCKQLLLNKPLPLMIQDLWQYHSNRETQPTLDSMLRALEIVLLEYSRIYLIIDALDEYFNTTHEHRAVFIQNVVKISKQYPIHLMITTRPSNMSQDRFSNLQLVSIQAEKSDINLYIENQFNKSDNLFRLLKNRPQLKTDIQLAVAQDVGGMFLLAKLRMDHLRAQPTVASLQEGLKTLPSTLGIAYETTMTRINAQAEGIQKLAHKALMWITNTFRPLSVAELCQAIAIDNEDTCLTSDKISEIDSIMSACAGLVLLNHKKSVVHLIHYTAHEWLQQYFQNAHKQIASTCFQYLAFSDFEELEKINPKLVKQQYPLVVYAQYCLHHTGRTEQCEIEMLNQVEQFSNTVNNWRAIWIALPQSSRLDFWRHGPWPEHEEVIGSLGLAAAANLKTIAKHILRAREVDPKGERLALSLGVYGEHVEIVKTLLQSSRIKPEWGLQGAIQKKHWEIVKMLLEAGADVNIVGGKYGTALQAAAYTESEPIVKMLLDAGADVNLVGGYYGSALHAATWRQYEPIVKMLLDNGADMNIVGEQYGSALHAAASIKSIKSKLIVKMLLEAGADVNFVGGEYGTALQAASYTKSEAIVKMLFDAGANVNIVSGEHGTALQAAAWTESEPIVKMLLDAGADVNLVGGYFGTALQAAASIKSKVIVKMLLEAGADVNLVGGYYETALHAAACRESEPIVKMLLDNGADMNIVGGYYGTALQAAAYVESESIVQMLLDNGADMNIVGGQYGGALHAAAWRESEPIVKMLLDAGADVNLVGGYYGTALQTAAYVESESIVQMLLDNGADMNILGGEYGTALQAAAYVNSGSIVNILLEKGADMNILGGEYGTALQAAIAWVGLESDSTTDSDTTADSDSTTDYPAESDPIAESDCTSGSGSSVESDSTAELGYTAGSGSSAGVDSIVKLLLDAGADVNMRGGKYGSALKAAKVLGQQTILQMLLEAGAISTDCDEQEEKATPILQMAIPNPGRLFGFAHKLGGAF